MRVLLCPVQATSIWVQAKHVEKALKLKGHEVKFVKYVSMYDVVKKTAEGYVWFTICNPTWITHLAAVQHGIHKRPGVKAVVYTTVEGIPYPHVAMTCGTRYIEFTANSHFTKNCLETAGLKVVRVIHHAIDVDEARAEYKGAEKWRKKLEKDFPGKIKFLYVGRDDHRKNLSGLSEAVDILNKKHKDEYEVFMIADKNTFKNYDRPNVQFVGHSGEMDHGEIMRWMGAVDFFTFPSVSEGFGVPVLESLIMGSPVVCNKMPPLTEFTTEKVAIYYPFEFVEYLKTTSQQFFQMHRYKPENYANAMLQAIELKKGNPDEYENMRARSIEHAENWDLRKVYSDIV